MKNESFITRQFQNGDKWGWGQMEQINKFYGGQNGDGGKWGWGQINKF